MTKQEGFNYQVALKRVFRIWEEPRLFLDFESKPPYRPRVLQEDPSPTFGRRDETLETTRGTGKQRPRNDGLQQRRGALQRALLHHRICSNYRQAVKASARKGSAAACLTLDKRYNAVTKEMRGSLSEKLTTRTFKLEQDPQ